jgi:hypothetical protein
MYPEPLQGHELGIYQKQFQGAICRGCLEVNFQRFHAPAAFTHYSFLSQIVSIPESQLGRKALRPGHLYPLLVFVRGQVNPAVPRSYVSQISRDVGGFVSLAHRSPLPTTPIRGQVDPRISVGGRPRVNFSRFRGMAVGL